ncbi:DUF2397 family protein [Streptomyces griseoincarnatus]
MAAGPDTTGSRRATTGDGRVEIALSPPSDERTAVLRTTKGTLAGPDYVVLITAVGAASPLPRPGAARREAAG